MKKINLKNIVWKEDDAYVALNLNTNVSSFGDSRKEALDSLQEALELYFQDEVIENILKINRPNIVSSVLEYA